jgi:hypothetical protein
LQGIPSKNSDYYGVYNRKTIVENAVERKRLLTADLGIPTIQPSLVAHLTRSNQLK